MLQLHNHINPKNLDTRKTCCYHPKIWTRWLYHSVMWSKDAEGIANSVDPDQEQSDLGLHCLPRCLSVWKLRIITVFIHISTKILKSYVISENLCFIRKFSISRQTLNADTAFANVGNTVKIISYGTDEETVQTQIGLLQKFWSGLLAIFLPLLDTWATSRENLSSGFATR